MEELLRGADAVHRGEYRVVRPDGAHMWLDMSASLVRDADGKPLYRLVQALDVTERKTAEDRLRFLADHDPLSGVFNRRRFEGELQRELDLSAAARASSVLLLLDVDRFKAINDTLGHATGDAVIARLGDALRSRLRSADVIARLGGDEFAAILRRTDLPAAREVARDLQEVAAQRLASVVGDDHGPITFSVGLVEIGDGTSADELLSLADRALYAAKAAGRDRVVAERDVDGDPRAAGGPGPGRAHRLSQAASSSATARRRARRSRRAWRGPPRAAGPSGRRGPSRRSACRGCRGTRRRSPSSRRRRPARRARASAAAACGRRGRSRARA